MKADLCNFSIGMIFYYWNYYNNKNKQFEKEQHSQNINDHNGYKIKDLFIKQKYETFKSEILNYGFITIDEYYELVILKANQYLATNRVKKLRAKKVWWSPLHYDIICGTPISICHLISLILYCNFSALSTAFSNSFRKDNKNESLISIKKRNQLYWFFSKYLRESVEIFGEDKYHDKVKGPFFSGMSIEMVIPEFNIRLCSPVSTSKQIEVACRFGGEQGMVIQLNNNGDYYSSFYLRSFNCNWISSFKEEDEQLFIGGQWRIRVESIRLVIGWKNYNKLFHSLFYFDAMMSGTVLRGYNPKSYDILIISSLIEYELYGNKNNITNQFDEYMLDTFYTYCKNKNTIGFYMYSYGPEEQPRVWRDFKDLPNLLLHSVFGINNKGLLINNSGLSINNNSLLKDITFKLFKNLQTIHINRCNRFPFSLIKLLELLNSISSNVKIIIKAKQYKDIYLNNRSWIYESLNANEMKTHKNTKKYKFELNEVNQYGDMYDILSIERVN